MRAWQLGLAKLDGEMCYVFILMQIYLFIITNMFLYVYVLRKIIV